MKKLCDRNYNECSLMIAANSRILTKILNELRDKFGSDVTKIVNNHCPNLTCCYDCHIDDFCHLDGCELIDEE